MNDLVILLTGCVNPNGMIFTKLQDKDVRAKQYIEAITWYLNNTNLKIVFTENSGYELKSYINKEFYSRIEFLTYNGNDYKKELGKGYGEGLIIDYTLKNSKFIHSKSNIIKITGRLILTNINDIISWYLHHNHNNKLILCDVNRNITTAFSRVVIAPKSFYSDYFLNEVKKCNDSQGYQFENALATSIQLCKRLKKYNLSLFPFPYIFYGVSGSDGNIIKNKSKFTIYTKYFLFKLGIWAK
ncbi:hypothetical protein [Phocaeicola barnesiae]|uniref:hypothetical protein n=1 Tax=Phocaeicola barnesiae TaxID=376804 RepID=UPI0025A39C92|nr:hypothetical protein [Phocaeicola barnesiae]MDM8310359.1 hypothetical protein [Phocaeicola barnesiae]